MRLKKFSTRRVCPVCHRFLRAYTPGEVDKCRFCGTEFDHSYDEAASK